MKFSKVKDQFPETLYVYQPLDKTDPYDGYTTFEKGEEDDTVGVYKLTRVARIKKEVKVVLIDESTLKGQ